MQLSEIQFADATPIDGYGPGFFRIGGQVLTGPTVTHREEAGAWGGLEDSARLTALAGRVDVILLGTGAEIAQIPAALRQTVEDAGVGLEIMATPSACRTYNILLSEGRRVAAALLPV